MTLQATSQPAKNHISPLLYSWFTLRLAHAWGSRGPPTSHFITIKCTNYQTAMPTSFLLCVSTLNINGNFKNGFHAWVSNSGKERQKNPHLKQLDALKKKGKSVVWT